MRCPLSGLLLGTLLSRSLLGGPGGCRSRCRLLRCPLLCNPLRCLLGSPSGGSPLSGLLCGSLLSGPLHSLLGRPPLRFGPGSGLCRRPLPSLLLYALLSLLLCALLGSRARLSLGRCSLPRL